MKKYDIFGIGAALVDTEIVVTDDFLAEHGVGKGLMTLVDEERQDYLITKPCAKKLPTLKLFCNQDEAFNYTNSNNLEDAIEGLKSIAKTFVITQGEHGATAFDGAQIASVPGVTTEAVDTNGAGDMFAGAFLYAITSGQNYEWALGFANAAAARVVSQFGPRVTSIEYDRIKAQFNI